MTIVITLAFIHHFLNRSKLAVRHMIGRSLWSQCFILYLPDMEVFPEVSFHLRCSSAPAPFPSWGHGQWFVSRAMVQINWKEEDSRSNT